MKKIVIFPLIISLIFVSGFNGCYYLSSPPKMYVSNESIQNQCIAKCQELSQNIALDSQCILDPIPDTEWVCDIAHSPRAAEDNLPENQCAAFRNGTAKHFIELTPECKLIRMG